MGGQLSLGTWKYQISENRFITKLVITFKQSSGVDVTTHTYECTHTCTIYSNSCVHVNEMRSKTTKAAEHRNESRESKSSACTANIYTENGKTKYWFMVIERARNWTLNFSVFLFSFLSLFHSLSPFLSFRLTFTDRVTSCNCFRLYVIHFIRLFSSVCICFVLFTSTHQSIAVN